MALEEITNDAQIDASPFMQIAKDKSGYTEISPWTTYAPGIYTVSFEIHADAVTDQIDPIICGWVSVARSGSADDVEKTNLYLDRMRRDNGRIVLDFSLPQTASLQLRVFSTGRSALRVSRVNPITRILKKSYEPVIRRYEEVTDDFLTLHFHHFRFLYENGATVTSTPNGTIVTSLGVSFFVKAFDDFQLTNEIFFSHDYNFESLNDILAIDIGMNVGLTSLYMARRANVKEVHSFEPFRVPFRRALENFGLNLESQRKIMPSNFGLGGANEEFSVLSDTDTTIGTSIKGSGKGNPEKINVRDASEIFESLITRAKDNGWDIVVKMDCEGSEFAILESLVKSDLIKHIRVLMMEWHKGWSADKSQRDFVEPLLRHGFIVFDRTTPANIYAGMIWAVRVD